MTNLTALDLREIRHGSRRLSDLIQQPQPVGAQTRVVDIDRDLVEERVHMRPELGNGGHGREYGAFIDKVGGEVDVVRGHGGMLERLKQEPGHTHRGCAIAF